MNLKIRFMWKRVAPVCLLLISLAALAGCEDRAAEMEPPQELLTPEELLAAALAMPPENAEILASFQAEGFAAVRYTAEGADCLVFCGADGQPLGFEHKYLDLVQFDIFDLREADRPQLYKARYLDGQGRELYDVLDGQGELWQRELLTVDYVGGGVFEATQGWGDENTGLLNLHGSWTFVTSIFDGKVD